MLTLCLWDASADGAGMHTVLGHTLFACAHTKVSKIAQQHLGMGGCCNTAAAEVAAGCMTAFKCPEAAHNQQPPRQLHMANGTKTLQQAWELLQG